MPQYKPYNRGSINTPIACSSCGELFVRSHGTQKRCDACLLVDDDQVQRITATHEKLHPAKRGDKPQGFTRLRVEPLEVGS
jgi:hypothetical protein